MLYAPPGRSPTLSLVFTRIATGPTAAVPKCSLGSNGCWTQRATALKWPLRSSRWAPMAAALKWPLGSNGRCAQMATALERPMGSVAGLKWSAGIKWPLGEILFVARRQASPACSKQHSGAPRWLSVEMMWYCGADCARQERSQRRANCDASADAPDAQCASADGVAQCATAGGIHGGAALQLACTPTSGRIKHLLINTITTGEIVEWVNVFVCGS